jgi:hypothetical protein
MPYPDTVSETEQMYMKGHDRGASFSFICHSAVGNLVILPKETDGPAVGNLLAATCEDHRQDDET